MGEAPDPARATVVCILGPSRSGTSLTARVLGLAGLYLGPEDTMFPPSGANPSGFWEQAGMSGLSEKILESLGGSWRNPPTMPEGWEEESRLQPARDRARLVIGKIYAGHDLWGWKDPRACLTLPFWQSILPEMRYVICLRNPIDVAASLQRRDGISAEESNSLWLAYTAAALLHTSGRRRIFVSYEKYFEDWRAVARRLVRFLGLPARAVESEVGWAIGEEIDDGLRHHRAGAAAGIAPGTLPDDVADLYLSIDSLRARSTERGSTSWRELAELEVAIDQQAAQLTSIHLRRPSGDASGRRHAGD